MALRLLDCMDRVQNRRNLRRQRVFLDRTNPVEAFSDQDLKQRCRFDRAGLRFITDLLSPQLQSATKRNFAIPPVLQVYAALRFYASGSFQLVSGDTVSLSQPSLSRIVQKVTVVLCTHLNEFITFPTSPAEIGRAREEFFQIPNGGFPSVIGCIDCTHAKIIAPNEDEFAYINRKNFHSMNIQGICSANRKFINIVARFPGSVHDARVFSDSIIGREINNGQRPRVVLLGDKGYACTKQLLTPFHDPRTDAEKRYNVAHKKVRARIEQAFGILKRKWACLHLEVRMSPERVCAIVTACAILHNIGIDRQNWDINDIENVDPDSDGDDHGETNARALDNTACRDGKAFRMQVVRTHFTNIELL